MLGWRKRATRLVCSVLRQRAALRLGSSADWGRRLSRTRASIGAMARYTIEASISLRAAYARPCRSVADEMGNERLFPCPSHSAAVERML